MILASGSPQRRAILQQLGVEFTVVVSDAEELEAGPAEQVAVENARRKASVVAAGLGPAHPGGNAEAVLGVDTVVALDSQLYGKPADLAQAAATLRALAGRTHRVVSGLCVIDGAGERTASAVTQVSFRPLGGGALD